jgi:HAD superfamily hydrolase (TIGR01484 family)
VRPARETDWLGAMMLVTDLDGTLLDSRSQLSAASHTALLRLGEQGIVRVVATGRSLHSALHVLDARTPIDFLVFSSGAGICAWPSGALLATHALRAEQVTRVLAILQRRRLDFMLHRRVPDNHRFLYWSAGGDNPDFARRCARDPDFAELCPARLDADLIASQFLAIEAPRVLSQREALAAELAPDLRVVLTTSPLDRESRWLEIFPEHVSKARASAWICERTGVDARRVVALGNDFNDLDLLAWAAHPHVVANAPESMRACYRVVASNDEDGFAQVAELLLRTRDLQSALL